MSETQLDFKKLGKGVEIAEAQRETTRHTGFLSSVFRGKPDFNLIFPWPKKNSPMELLKEVRLIDKIYDFFKTISPKIVTGEEKITLSLMAQMGELGLFRLKVPEELGGYGLSQTSYTRVIGYLSTHCPAIAIMVSADNTIGAKFPVLYLGTEEQKKKYLPRLTVWPSAFCFTEKEVGSDPARMRTYAMRIRDEAGNVKGYQITGEKWYATNSVLNGSERLAEYLAVVVKIVDKPENLDDKNYKDCFGLFIVSTQSKGFVIRQDARFLGMSGIFNGVLSFNSVEVAKDELIGGEGAGFKIALNALNTGRIAIGGSCTAASKQALSIINWWANERKQWGRTIGEWELIGSGICAESAANILAMEAVTYFAAARTDLKQDSRLEAAVCKVVASEWGWKIVDDMIQVRGGRGYETGQSLSRREITVAADQLFRDSRPNRIFEGSTQILSQWVIREGLDEYLKKGAPFFKPGMYWKKIRVATGFTLQFIRSFISSRISSEIPGGFRKHLKFVEKNSRRLVRAIIWLSAQYRDKMMFKQLTLARLFTIASELYAITAVCSYAANLGEDTYGDLADLFCRKSARRVNDAFRDLWDNDDAVARKVAKKVLNKEYPRLEQGIATVNDLWMKNF